MWQLRQLEKLFELEPDLVAAALEELLQSHKVLCEKMVIGAYLGGVKALATDDALGVFAKGIDQGILPATSLK